MRRIIPALLVALTLSGCAGSQLSSVRGPQDPACAGVMIGAGGGQVGLWAPGAIGTLDITPSGCKITVTGWTWPPATTPVQPLPNVPQVAPVPAVPQS